LAKKHKSGTLEEAFAEAAQHAAESQANENGAGTVPI
jgi:hypothetical protein